MKKLMKKVTQEHYDLEAVTRLEIIDSNGRSYVNLHANPMEFSYQNDGKTLKIFCGNKEDMSKPEPKIDMKEERVDPVSIWKDVNEKIDNQSIIFVNKAGYARLAEYWNDKIYFIEGDSGDVRAHCIDKNYYGKKFCTLTDFINSFDQMQKDIQNLTKLIKHNEKRY